MLSATPARAWPPWGEHANPAHYECCGMAILIGAIILGLVLCLVFEGLKEQGLPIPEPRSRAQVVGAGD